MSASEKIRMSASEKIRDERQRKKSRMNAISLRPA